MMGAMRQPGAKRAFRFPRAWICLEGALVATLFSPSLVRSQGVAREAMSNFPADTAQLAYLNLAQLRAMPEYPQIRQRLLNRQLRDFQDFLRSMGTDPDRDVDELMLGWRGEESGGASLFGRAEGRFDPERIHQFFQRQQLPSREYAGLDLYAFGSGADAADVFFAFLGPTSAAFGCLADLKALLDARAGIRPALDSNAAFVDWEAELEGTSPQWGIATGKAAANQAGPWLAAGGKLSVEASTLFGPVRAVLYRVDWGLGITTHVSIVCQDAEAATALAGLIILWRDSRQSSADNPTSAAIRALIQGLEVQASGSRVELTASGPMDAIDQVMRGSVSSSGP